MLLWGDLHNHCGITYGFGSLQNALKIARSHLDFCCITGHAMWPDIYARTPETEFIVDFHREGFKKLLEHWDEIRAEMARQNDGELVTFQSYEMHSSLYGDHHIISPDDTFPLIYRDSPARLVADCGVRAIAVPHHIGYTPGYRGINWELYDQNITTWARGIPATRYTPDCGGAAGSAFWAPPTTTPGSPAPTATA